MLINAQESTLLIIDIQERLFPVIEGNTALAEHSAWLIQVAQRVGVPVLLTEQYSKGLGPTIATLRDGISGDSIVEKLHFSAARDGELFKRPGGERRQFVVCGTETHICVLQTVLDLIGRGNRVFVVDEALGSRRASDKALGSVDVSLRAALLRQMTAGKARDAGNGRSLAKSRNAAWRHLPRNPKGRAVAAATKRQQTLGLARMQQAGASIVSREMVAFEWMEQAGTDLFRSISREFIR
jgi:nicotinamidase-related amidase